jgi:eukaryotic-like serine/threonine-protein kinase
VNEGALEFRPLPAAGDEVGRYRVLAAVAQGGMAAVYVVRPIAAGLEKLFAMKVLLPHLSHERRFVDMFLDEARIASCVAHPNVVSVFDVGEDRGSPFLVMEYLRGQSLSALVREVRKRSALLPLPIALGVLAKVARGLHAAHEARSASGEKLGIVHRDVSPQNVHVDYAGDVRVVDFGIASAAGRITATRTGEVKGKLAYLAPEQLDPSRKIDRRVDIWAFGVMAYELFTGEPAFRADEDAHTIWNVLNRRLEHLCVRAPEVPGDVADLVMRCVERKRHDRPSSAEEIAAILEAAGGAGNVEIAAYMENVFGADRERLEKRLAEIARGVSTPTPAVEHEVAAHTETSSVRRRIPRRRATIGAIAIAIVAIGIAGALAIPRFFESPAPPPRPAPVARIAPPQIAAPEPMSRTLTLEAPSSIRMVLVDGVRHDERPVVIEVVEDAEIVVETIDEDGRIARRTVRAEDGDVSLAPHAIEARPRRARRRERAPAEAPREERELHSNPYGP